MAAFDFHTLLQEPASIARYGLLAERGEHGVCANVRHVVHHSPAGLNFGYGGSGPADLALSALCALISPPDPEDERWLLELDSRTFMIADADDRLWSERVGPDNVRISRLAWKLHQPFKTTFVMTMKGDSAYVPLRVMLEWIDMQSKTLRERISPDPS